MEKSPESDGSGIHPSQLCDLQKILGLSFLNCIVGELTEPKGDNKIR